MHACEFTPARVRGRAVRVRVQIPIDFKINAPWALRAAYQALEAAGRSQV